MSKKLYIHIGSHKTGTTSIQKALFENQDILKKYNLSYFSKNPDGSEDFHRNINKWFIHFPQTIQNGFVFSSIEIFANELSKLPSDVIISAEYFSYFFLKHEIEKLKNTLAEYFEEIKIILYLRRQDQQTVSHHNQASKHFQFPSSFLFGIEASALPVHQEHFRLYLDYNEKISMWSDVFGQENMIIKIFEKTTLLNGDVVSDFFNIFGIHEFKNITQTNESSNFEKAKIGFLMNQVAIQNGLFRNTVNKNLISQNKLLPKRKDAQNFYELYRESNIELNKKFNISPIESIFNEDFSMYPIEGNELWSEESANNTITAMLKSLNETYGSIDYGTLFHAALKLENSDFQLSYNIMQMLYKMLPQEPNVQVKLKSYIEFIDSVKNKNIHNKEN